MSKSKGRKPDPDKSLHPEEDVLTNAISLGMQGHELRRITNVIELLSDRATLLQIAEIVSTGGSVETVEMATGLPPGLLKGWLKNGKTDREGSEYNALYRFYLAAASEARRAAEASLLMKNPSAWLDRCDPLKQLDVITEPEAINTTAKVKSTDDSSTVQYRDFG